MLIGLSFMAHLPLSVEKAEMWLKLYNTLELLVTWAISFWVVFILCRKHLNY